MMPGASDSQWSSQVGMLCLQGFKDDADDCTISRTAPWELPFLLLLSFPVVCYLLLQLEPAHHIKLCLYLTMV